MKKLIYTIVIMLFATIAQGQVLEFSYYKLGGIQIYSKDSFRSGVSLGDLKSKVISQFGKPYNMKTEYSIGKQTDMDIFMYDNTKFTFVSNKLVSLDIPNFSNSSFTIGNDRIKLQSSAASVAELFGYSGRERMLLPSNEVSVYVGSGDYLEITWSSHVVEADSSPKGVKKRVTKEKYTVIDKINSIRLYRN